MSDFQIYLKLGFQHIIDLKGYDHILFVVALCTIYVWANWRQVGVLVTAFTIGHSITLALATLQIIKLNTDLIELLIPVTIVITAFNNLFHTERSKNRKDQSKSYLRYILALCFGFIHGMGFSNYLRSLLGKEESIFTPLLAFNIGLELGQLIIVSIVLILANIAISIFKVNMRDWRMVISSIVAGMALVLVLNSAYFIDLLK